MAICPNCDVELIWGLMPHPWPEMDEKIRKGTIIPMGCVVKPITHCPKCGSSMKPLDGPQLFEDIIQAANNYPNDKYSGNFYQHHLKVLKLATRVDESVIRAVKYLFLWELGKVSTKKTPKGYDLDFIDPDGTRYFATNTTGANNRVINKAIDMRNLEAAFRFRDGSDDLETFKYVARGISYGSVVLPIFYMHIWRPSECSIFDTNVWKAFCYYNTSCKKRTDNLDLWVKYKVYVSFFQEVVRITNLDWRIVDRGLRVIGARLPKSPDQPYPLPPQPSLNPIPQHILDHALEELTKLRGNIPFQEKGIKISVKLIMATMEILNSAPTKILPQYCRQAAADKTPDGLDGRIKQYLKIDLRTANIISDVLAKVPIVKVIEVGNPITRWLVKGTRLLNEWTW